MNLRRRGLISFSRSFLFLHCLAALLLLFGCASKIRKLEKSRGSIVKQQKPVDSPSRTINRHLRGLTLKNNVVSVLREAPTRNYIGLGSGSRPIEYNLKREARRVWEQLIENYQQRANQDAHPDGPVRAELFSPRSELHIEDSRVKFKASLKLILKSSNGQVLFEKKESATETSDFNKNTVPEAVPRALSKILRKLLVDAFNKNPVQTRLVYDQSGTRRNSDVDETISKKKSFPNTIRNKILKRSKAEKDNDKYFFAVGISEYDAAPPVKYARRSTLLFQTLANQYLGVPKENTTVLLDSNATGTKIEGYLTTFLNRVGRGDTVYFYYAGHGVPSRTGEKSFILPHDGVVGAYEQPNFALSNLYERFQKSGARKVTVIMDNCFSGKADENSYVFDGIAPAGRVTRRKTSKADIENNMTVLTAGKSNQFANIYEKVGHRLFSHYVAKGILRDLEAKELMNYIRTNVKRTARKKGPTYSQTPQIYGNSNLIF